MTTTKSYPEIEALGMTDTKAAIAMGEANLSAVTPEFRLELITRLNALYAHMRILYHAKKR